MSVEQGLFQLIASDTTITSIVGQDKNGTTKVYWVLAPKASPVPYIILNRVATTDTYIMSGDIGLRAALFQVDCYATDYYTSRAIAQAVRDVLSAFRGNLTDQSGTAVQAVFQTKDWDMEYEEGSNKGFVFRALQEYRVVYNDGK